MYGTEIELSLAATDNLVLTLNYGLQDTELEEYNSLDAPERRSPAIGDASGQRRRPRVPKHTVTASAMYTHGRWVTAAPTGSSAATTCTTRRPGSTPRTWPTSATVNLLNARIGVENDNWTAAFYVDNLLDDDTPLLGTEFPNFERFPHAPSSAFHIVPRRGRNAGLALTLRF